jgi:hypothetical protein
MNSLKIHNLPIQSAEDAEFTPATFDAIERNQGNEEYMSELGRYIGSTLFHNAEPEQDIDTTIAISVDLVTEDLPERTDMSAVLKGVISGFREEESALESSNSSEVEEESQDSEDEVAEEVIVSEITEPTTPVRSEVSESTDWSDDTPSYDLPASVEEVERHIHRSHDDDSNSSSSLDSGLGKEW